MSGTLVLSKTAFVQKIGDIYTAAEDECTDKSGGLQDAFNMRRCKSPKNRKLP